MPHYTESDLKPDFEHLTIDDLRALARQHGWRGVIVLQFGDRGLAGTSYGRSKRDCNDMRRVMGKLMREVESGTFPVWVEW